MFCPWSGSYGLRTRHEPFKAWHQSASWSGLFTDRISSYQEEQINAAKAQVNALTQVQLLSPTLAGVLERIASVSLFEVATLRSDDKIGKNRKEVLAVNTEIKLLDITIPYAGSKMTFHYSPTRCTEIEYSVIVQEDALVLTLNDDEHVDRYLYPFIERVAENLDQLRKDMTKLSDAIRASVHSAAERRKEGLTATKERNKTLGFPID